ncbi:hypothetical protein J5U21_02266 [Saccharolobus shibatae]|uniref:Uncharacterized protein n=1 Tax=Saccharolobus shibatae TaxID=2286 RepID=A0A8F5BWD2_9CREN|nr:hypothetical protein J5U21_02266 [Saccharolobus shibatae]
MDLYGPKRENLWIWNVLQDGVPFFTTGDRDYRTFSYLLNTQEQGILH